MIQTVKTNASRFGLALAGITAAMVTFATVAMAQTATDDPTGGAAESTLASLKDWVTNHGGPLMIGLLVVGIVFSLVVKFAKRGARAV